MPFEDIIILEDTDNLLDAIEFTITSTKDCENEENLIPRGKILAAPLNKVDNNGNALYQFTLTLSAQPPEDWIGRFENQYKVNNSITRVRDGKPDIIKVATFSGKNLLVVCPRESFKTNCDNIKDEMIRANWNQHFHIQQQAKKESQK